MSAELKLITTRALVRPSYVHHELLGVDRPTWVFMNLAALEDWYRATGPSNPFDEQAFRDFTWSQYEMETSNREELKREWASLPRDRRDR